MSSSRFATAVHVLTLLATQPNESLTSDYIAGSVNTNPVVIRRLLRRLADAGLVVSTAGTTGGTRLARDPKRITLRDAFAAVENGQLFGEHSQQPNPKCPVGAQIVEILAPRIAAAQDAAIASLGRTTIAQLLREVKTQ